MRCILAILLLGLSVATRGQGIFDTNTVVYYNKDLPPGWSLVVNQLHGGGLGFQGGFPAFSAFIRTNEAWQRLDFAKDEATLELLKEIFTPDRAVFFFNPNPVSLKLTFSGHIRIDPVTHVLKKGLNLFAPTTPIDGRFHLATKFPEGVPVMIHKLKPDGAYSFHIYDDLEGFAAYPSEAVVEVGEAYWVTVGEDIAWTQSLPLR